LEYSRKNLTLAQSAVLAAIPKAPSYYSPWGSHTKELLTRQRIILFIMAELGKISKDELNLALAEKIKFQPQFLKDQSKLHFVMMVQDYLDWKIRRGNGSKRGTLRSYNP